MPIDKVVILARGLGTRMQRDVESLKLKPEVEEMVKKGWKAFIPIKDKPFLDYLINELRKAGLRKICLVIGPEHEEVRRYYEELDRKDPTLSISFAIQEKPLGTANAVYAAREFAGDDSFIVVNGDNLYFAETLRILKDQKNQICYAIGFEKDYLIANSNFDEDRIRSFAVMMVDEDFNLVKIIEKPDDPEKYRTRFGILISMNLWRFTPHIFWACERIEPHPVRKEYELTSAVQLLIDEKVIPVKIIPVKAGILDLTYRFDIPAVEERLKLHHI